MHFDGIAQGNQLFFDRKEGVRLPFKTSRVSSATSDGGASRRCRFQRSLRSWVSKLRPHRSASLQRPYAEDTYRCVSRRPNANAHDGDFASASKASRMESNKRPPSSGFSTIGTPAAAARLRKFWLGAGVMRIAGVNTFRSRR